MKCKLLSHVQLLVTPWNSPWNSPGQNTGVDSLSLLQGIFPAQGLNQGLLHCRQILYQLSFTREAPGNHWLGAKNPLNHECTNFSSTFSSALSWDRPRFCTCDSGLWGNMSSLICDRYPEAAVTCETFPVAQLCNPCLCYYLLLWNTHKPQLIREKRPGSQLQ